MILKLLNTTLRMSNKGLGVAIDAAFASTLIKKHKFNKGH